MTEMNLVEQLGGYEATKEYLKENSRFINFEGLERFYDDIIEYRRQNNIFEVGDDVCFKTLGDGYVHKYTKYHEFKYDLRHATPEEIKAGKRLDVNQ